MNVFALVLIVLCVVGVGCVLLAIGQLWAVGGGIDDPVGSLRPRRPAPAPPSIVPGEFRALIHAESIGWKRPNQWHLLTEHLDGLEAELGGEPAMPAPTRYSAAWLDDRLSRIEALAGPLPAPIRPQDPAPTRRRNWLTVKNWKNKQ